MRAVRLTWTIGGAGLILCGVLGMLSTGAGSVVLTVAIDVVYALAVLVFAVGMSREASVVARRPLGVIALAVVAVWPIVPWIAQLSLPTPSDAFDAGLPAYRELQDTLAALFYVDLFVSLAVALVAAVQIARAGTVPAPWRWAPVWALAVAVVAGALPQVVYALVDPAAVQAMADLTFAVGRLGFLVGTLGLGILALVLASRRRHDGTEVFRSA